MSKRIVVSAGVGLLLAGAGLFLWLHPGASSPESGARKGAATEAAPARAPLSREESERLPPAEDLESLLKQGTPQAWSKIAALYPSQDIETKRGILQRIGKMPELSSALYLVLQTVGNDPTPASEDRMVSEAAEILRRHWKTPEDMDYGRQQMLAQKTEKAKWVAAKALITFAADVREGSPFFAQKGRLEGKLVDLHSAIQDPFIRGELVDGLGELGSRDAALILAEGSEVRDEDLAGIREERAAVDEVLAEQGTRQ